MLRAGDFEQAVKYEELALLKKKIRKGEQRLKIFANENHIVRNARSMLILRAIVSTRLSKMATSIR